MMSAPDSTIFILPGLYNSGPGHWQTLWEAQLPGARRIQQTNWDAPDREQWVATLDTAVRATRGTIVFAAHSLGCALTVWWAERHGADAHAARVAGALLVAPPDVERDSFRTFATGFGPMPSGRLPFPAIVVSSGDDPWCALPRARAWAAGWGARFHDIGARGHINADSGLDDWPQGRQWLAELQGRLS